MENKQDYIILIITTFILSVTIIVFTYNILEMIKDYKCSTTNDRIYYDKNNCMRFEK